MWMIYETENAYWIIAFSLYVLLIYICGKKNPFNIVPYGLPYFKQCV